MEFEVKNRVTGAVQFTAQIEADESTPYSVKLGLAQGQPVGCQPAQGQPVGCRPVGCRPVGWGVRVSGDLAFTSSLFRAGLYRQEEREIKDVYGDRLQAHDRAGI